MTDTTLPGVRRIVTTHDATGKAIVSFDGPAPNRRIRDAGLVSTLLWTTDVAPAQHASDDRGAVTIGVTPPATGTVLRVVDFPPFDETTQTVDAAKLTAEMGIAGHDTGGRRAPTHPFMHATDSVDYAIVLHGEIDMLLDDSTVHLNAGDILVQQGTNHAWVNRGTQTCRIAFVLVGAEAPLS